MHVRAYDCAHTHAQYLLWATFVRACVRVCVCVCVFVVACGCSYVHHFLSRRVFAHEFCAFMVAHTSLCPHIVCMYVKYIYLLPVYLYACQCSRVFIYVQNQFRAHAHASYSVCGCRSKCVIISVSDDIYYCG